MTLNTNKLDEPLDFHMEKLAEEYGHIEIIQSQITLLELDDECQEVVQLLEKARNEISNILGKRQECLNLSKS